MDNSNKNQGKRFPRTWRGSTTESLLKALLTLETTKLLLQTLTLGEEEENKV